MENKNLLEKNIISELGLDALPEKKKAGLVNKISELVEKRLTLRLMKEVGEDALEDVDKVAEASDKDKAKFLRDNVDNLEEIMQEEIEKVKEDVIDRVHEIENE